MVYLGSICYPAPSPTPSPHSRYDKLSDSYSAEDDMYLWPVTPYCTLAVTEAGGGEGTVCKGDEGPLNRPVSGDTLGRATGGVRKHLNTDPSSQVRGLARPHTIHRLDNSSPTWRPPSPSYLSHSHTVSRTAFGGTCQTSWFPISQCCESLKLVASVEKV